VGSLNYDDDEAPAPNVQRTTLTYYGYATKLRVPLLAQERVFHCY
jgi:hypothetical protein